MARSFVEPAAHAAEAAHEAEAELEAAKVTAKKRCAPREG
jgi:hypothetical protein